MIEIELIGGACDGMTMLVAELIPEIIVHIEIQNIESSVIRVVKYKLGEYNASCNRTGHIYRLVH